jgi:ribosomal protein S18 acetylase RimI-like enzyme
MSETHAGVRVRPARHQDVLALSVIWQELMQMHERRDARFALAVDAVQRWCTLAHEVLDRGDGFLLAAEHGGKLAGFCLGWLAKNPVIYHVSDVGFISELAVSQATRRRGIGRALLQTAREWFGARHVSEFQLSTAVWNEDAQAFWRALGGAPLLLRYRFEVNTGRQGV